ncbi:MAG: hypothetical protein IPI49_08625 [Myxococcales bacterium]|nr:hypothetical protein [Myxococcales bacterium]
MSAPARRLFIVGPVYDWVFFLAPPMLSLLVGILLADTSLTNDVHTLAGEEDTAVGFFLGATIHAHLVAVFVRSHGNASIRRLYPWRFFAVPLALYLAIVGSVWIAVAATVVATWWDVWHSGAQTFGFARIYERNAGTAPELGRRLDFWLNQLLYAGPILAGATLVDHLESFEDFGKLRAALFSPELAAVPSQVLGHRGALAWAVVGLGSAFLLGYVAAYWRWWRQGWRPSWIKVWLLSSTAAVSIYSWGWNSWGQAFLIMNLFHAVQYLGLVWAMEGRTFAAWLRLRRHPRAALAVFVGSVALYGLGTQLLDADLTALWAITLVVSLMHFWYDAFVWSVRKAQI